jgi:hypothetical protein
MHTPATSQWVRIRYYKLVVELGRDIQGRAWRDKARTAQLPTYGADDTPAISNAETRQ